MFGYSAQAVILVLPLPAHILVSLLGISCADNLGRVEKCALLSLVVLTANGSGLALDAFKQCMVDPPCGQRWEVVPGRCGVVLVFRPCTASLARGCSSLASTLARLRQEYPLRSLSEKRGQAGRLTV
jgi:hypothetical protein